MEYFFEIGLLLFNALIGIVVYQSKRQSDTVDKKMNDLEEKFNQLNNAREARNETVNKMFYERDLDYGQKLHEISIQLTKITK